MKDRVFLVGVETRNAAWDAGSSLDELEQLATTAGASVVGRATQRLDSPNPATYIGKGKLDEVKSQRANLGYNTVIFDDELSPSQQRNLERALDAKVIDRTALILDIFATRARTKEGRQQVELAQHQYLLPRLAGQWSHLERLEGAIGTRGPGETQLETDRRLVRNRIKHLKGQLEQVRTQRGLYRRNRRRSGIPIIALVGYTNAGKSTLMQALSGEAGLAEDKLFATLDPLTRRVRLGEGIEALLTDTVGFIQKLPTQLVAAFRATLEELEEADLLLHVVDISHPMMAEQSETVEATLHELGVDEKPRVTVLNKIDLVTQSVDPTGAEQAEELQHLAGTLPANAALVSASNGWGIEDLKRRLRLALGARDGAASGRLAG